MAGVWYKAWRLRVGEAAASTRAKKRKTAHRKNGWRQGRARYARAAALDKGTGATELLAARSPAPRRKGLRGAPAAGAAAPPADELVGACENWAAGQRQVNGRRGRRWAKQRAATAALPGAMCAGSGGACCPQPKPSQGRASQPAGLLAGLLAGWLAGRPAAHVEGGGAAAAPLLLPSCFCAGTSMLARLRRRTGSKRGARAAGESGPRVGGPQERWAAACMLAQCWHRAAPQPSGTGSTL